MQVYTPVTGIFQIELTSTGFMIIKIHALKDTIHGLIT